MVFRQGSKLKNIYTLALTDKPLASAGHTVRFVEHIEGSVGHVDIGFVAAAAVGQEQNRF